MPVELKLPDNQFDNIIRMIKKVDSEKLDVLATAVTDTMSRLKFKRDVSKAVKGVPDGSDQTDIMSIVVWLKKVPRRNRVTKRQVVTIDATIASRMGV